MTETIKLAIVISAAFRGGPAFDKAGGGLKGLKAAIKKVRAEIMLLAGYAAFNFLKKGFNVFVQFEQRMAEAGSIVGATKDEIADFSEQIREMTKTLPQTADELGAGLYDVFSAGVTNTAEAMDTLNLAAKAAIAGLTSTAQAVKAGVATMNAFGLSMDDLNHIYDVQFLTIKRGILRYGDLVEQIGKMAPSAKAAGQSMEDMFGTLAFLTTKGLSAAEASTALSRAYDALTMPATVKKFRELGVAVADMSDATLKTDPVLVGMRQAMADAESELVRLNQSVVEATADYESQSKELNELEMAYNSTKEAMAEFGDEMSDISLSQRKNRLEVSKIKQKADKEDRDLTKGELARIESLEDANDDLRIQYEDLGIQQTELSKVAKEQEKTVNAASEAHKDAGEEVTRLTELQVEAAESLTKTNDAYDIQIAQTGKFRPLVDIIADLNAEMGSMSEVAKAQLIAKIFPQIRARKAIMGIIQDTEALTANIDEMADATSSGGAMQEAFAINVDTTANELKLMNNSVEDLQMSITEDLMPVIKGFMDMLRPLLQFLSENTEVIWLLVAAFAAYKIVTLASTIATSTFGIALMATPIGWVIAAIAGLVVALVALYLWWDEVTAGVQALGDKIGEYLGPIIDKIVASFQWLFDTLGNVWGVLGDIAGGIADFFGGLVDSALGWGKDLIENFIEGVKSAMDDLLGIFGDIWDGITGFLGFDIRANDMKVERWGEDMGSYFAQGIKNAIPQVESAAEEVRTTADSGIVNSDVVTGEAATVGGAGAGTTTIYQDTYEINLNVDKIEEGMDMKGFVGDLAEEIDRQKKTLGGTPSG